MKTDFELILEESLAQMRSGVGLEECLAKYPAQAGRLRPLLQAAARVRELPIPRARPEAVQAGREKLLADARAQGLTPNSTSSHGIKSREILGVLAAFLYGRKRSRWSLVYRLAMALVLALLVMSGISVGASASSLPGDKLYPVKRTWESIRLALTLSQQRKQTLLDQFAAERRGEVKELIQLGRSGTVEFQAPIEEIDAERWLVDGFQVIVDAETEVEGNPEAGQAVDIRARLEADGTLNAIRVRIPSEVQSPSHPPISPIPTLTPDDGEDSEDHPGEPTSQRTPRATQGNDDNEDRSTPRPSPTPEHEASATQSSYRMRTPEPTEGHESQRTPEPSETRRPPRSPEPTEEHHDTPEPTSFRHETPEPTDWHHETPVSTEDHHENPAPTGEHTRTPEPTEEH